MKRKELVSEILENFDVENFDEYRDLIQNLQEDLHNRRIIVRKDKKEKRLKALKLEKERKETFINKVFEFIRKRAYNCDTTMIEDTITINYIKEFPNHLSKAYVIASDNLVQAYKEFYTVKSTLIREAMLNTDIDKTLAFKTSEKRMCKFEETHKDWFIK